MLLMHTYMIGADAYVTEVNITFVITSFISQLFGYYVEH